MERGIMLNFAIVLISALVANAAEQDPIANQVVAFKEKTKGPIGILTTLSGAPINKNDTVSTLNKKLLTNQFFVDTVTHFVRERIPVRSVHPKGAGAFGYFETSRDMSDICKAEFLNGVGTVTPVAVRFSMGATERGGSDLLREPRGFAVKFYTKHGNFDIVGFNTPIFVYKEPNLFVPFAHAMRPNPQTDMPDLNMIWDAITHYPESAFIFMIVYSDRGIPDGYRHMPGFSIHTYPIYNAAGKLSYARFFFRPLTGTNWLNSTEAATIASSDPNYCARDLYKAIARGDYPSWELNMQIMSEEDLKNATFDPFDATKVIPESQFPWTPVGKMVLNRYPKNYYAEVELAAYCPCNLVPGISVSPSKLFEARCFSYKDAHRSRLGVNYDQIQVNCPYRSKVLTYMRDGVPPVGNNGEDAPNYYLNSFNGPIPEEDDCRPTIPDIHETEADNHEQAREYYETQILGEERDRLANNMASTLCSAAGFLQERVLKVFSKIHWDLGERISKALEKNNCKH